MYYAYILMNTKGVLYKGSTENLDQRLQQHNSNKGFSSYTAKRGPWKLVYFEQFNTREKAESKEKFFKTGKGREFIKNKLTSYLSRGSSVS